jgi:predicted metalloprotease with PDZ domain
VLDIILRDSTRNARGLDDFMRAMYSRFALRRGFTSADVERTASDVCGCDLHTFFENHVRGSRPIEFNRYLASVGLRAVVDTIPATDSAGRPQPDLRVWAYPPKSGGRMRVMIQDPSSVWARAGLHTGNEIITFNRATIDSFPDFRRAVRSTQLGDDVPVVVSRNGRRETITVKVGGYDRVRVRIHPLSDLTSSQRARQVRWSSASPS